MGEGADERVDEGEGSRFVTRLGPLALTRATHLRLAHAAVPSGKTAPILAAQLLLPALIHRGLAKRLCGCLCACLLALRSSALAVDLPVKAQMGPRDGEHEGHMGPRDGEHEGHVGPRAGEHEGHMGPRAGEHEGRMGPRAGGFLVRR